MERVAIIKLDLNSIRLDIADVLPSGHFVIIDQMIETINYAAELDNDGFIRPARINETLNVLNMFKTLCDVDNVTKFIAIATNIFKVFKNQRSVFEEIYNANNFKFRIMTAEEELQTIYMGVVNTMEVPKALIIDIESGSTNLIYYNRRNVLNTEVIPLGASELAKMFTSTKSTPEDICKKMVDIYKDEIKEIPWLKDLDPEFKFVGVGEIFSNIATLSRKLKKYPLDLDHNYVMTKEDFTQVYELIKTLDIDKTRKIKGVSSATSDILASGVSIAKAFTDSLKIDELSISTGGLSEGLIFAHAIPFTNEKPISDLLGYSLETISLFYDKPETNSKQVGELSLILFRQLKVLHKLSRGYLKVLRIASIMYDSGKRIRFENHNKNSFNVVLNSNIQGASHREIVLAAFVCACQDSNDFNFADWVRYKDVLLEEDLVALKKLAIIVRIAEALDRTHKNIVVDVSCDVLGDSVIMKTITTGDATLEIREALKASLDFKKAYGKNLEVL